MLMAPEGRLVGLHARVDTTIGATRFKPAFWEAPLRLAVTLALPLTVRVPAVALKPAEEAPAGTLTAGGTVSRALLLASATLLPPTGTA